MAALERRRFGAYLTAIREDENACEALGVDTFRYKMLAMVLSSFLTGVGGTFYAFYLFSLQPNAVFGIPLSVEIIIRPIVGGAGTVLGPILGSFILSPLAEISRTYFAQGGWNGAHLIVYGVLLIAVVLFLPQGAYPACGARSPRARAMSACSRCAGLAKRFGGCRRSPASPSTMAEGEMLGLIGPNGAGKTTVFNLLSGFLAPDAGDVRFRGRASSASSRTRSASCGLARTFQIVRPFPQLSVLDNVMVGALARHPDAREADARARAVVERVGLAASATRPRAASRSPSASAWSWRARSPPSRRCSCSTRCMAGLNATEIAEMVRLVSRHQRRPACRCS